MTWILIIILSGNMRDSGVAVTTQEYATQSACEDARGSLRQIVGSTNNVFICTPKGD